MKFRLTLIIPMLVSAYISAEAGVIKGFVYDRATKEPLIGATIMAETAKTGAATDIDGNFNLTLADGKHELIVTYVGYTDTIISSIDVKGEVKLDIPMSPDATSLSEVTVVAVARKDTEASMIEDEKESDVVQSGVSAQHIAKTQDKDASEVVRRIPGISIIDDKFVMVRGLSQRYNNVWLNGGAVPSSEADSRAFTFDIIPSSQLDNIVVVKSPAPEYPADFTGGFILVKTKYQPINKGFNVSIGTSVNDMTHFHDFKYSKGSKTDFLGFDGGLRALPGGINHQAKPYPGYESRLDPFASGFNNNWEIFHKKPIGDLKLNASYNNTWRF